jgi:hypothetical protein
MGVPRSIRVQWGRRRVRACARACPHRLRRLAHAGLRAAEREREAETRLGDTATDVATEPTDRQSERASERARGACPALATAVVAPRQRPRALRRLTCARLSSPSANRPALSSVLLFYCFIYLFLCMCFSSCCVSSPVVLLVELPTPMCCLVFGLRVCARARCVALLRMRATSHAHTHHDTHNATQHARWRPCPF